jgi:hypothetical protein
MDEGRDDGPMTLLRFAEDTVRMAFEEAVDSPRLDHPYWGRAIAAIARETGETPAECLARLEGKP